MGHTCGLCGQSKKLIQTDCCGEWICDDEDKYILFSYARNSCHRNHRRYTLCGHHHSKAHSGDWKTCKSCRKSCEPEMYAYYGTNEYNFEKLPNPPSYNPTHCTTCNKVISLGYDGYSMKGSQYFCEDCSHSPEIDRLLFGAVSSEQQKRKQKIFNGPPSIDKNLFHKLSMKWPAVKWIKALLSQNEEADSWMLGLLQAFFDHPEAFTGKHEWPLIHVIRILGEKRLTQAIEPMIKVHDEYSDLYDFLAIDEIVIALGKMGPPALEPLHKAFFHTEEDELKTTYLLLLSELGVKDERIKNGLLEGYHLDPVLIAGSIAEYGDMSLLPFLHEQVNILVPALKEQFPISRVESADLNLYIELRGAIVDLERGWNVRNISFSFEDYYRRKGKPIASDPNWAMEDKQYDDDLKEVDRRFFGKHLELVYEDDDDGNDDNEIPTPFMPFQHPAPKPGRNDPCPCGSG
ncbi:MAG: hypothetical protein HY540_04620, partial [Deltaproteobacteria bacterium]|nr:hypothetical protein [Deltaproteobacteria bacterium]